VQHKQARAPLVLEFSAAFSALRALLVEPASWQQAVSALYNTRRILEQVK